jgi:hypothetical protein
MEIATQLDSEPEAARFELARYETADGSRVLMADRAGGGFVITDRPARGDGRPYLVEGGVPPGPQLYALVRDYLEQADLHGRCPMEASAIDLHDSSRAREAIS